MGIDAEALLQEELQKPSSVTSLVTQRQLPGLQGRSSDKKHLASLQRMGESGENTVQAVGVMCAATVYAQGKVEAAATIMTQRILGTEREKVLDVFLTTVTGKLMVMMQAGVLAIVETLPERLGEEL